MTPPEIAFLQSTSGGAFIVLVANILFAITVWWARHNPDRIAAVWGGTGTALLVSLVTFIAFRAGWWQGAYSQIPWIVLFAINIPIQLSGYTLWLAWYRWLRHKTNWAWLIYGFVILLVFIPAVLFIDPIQMQRGQFRMGNGYTILWDALLGQIVLWSPVIFYELARKRIVKG